MKNHKGQRLKKLGIEFCITFSVWARKMGNFLLHIQIGKRDCLQLVEKIKRTPALEYMNFIRPCVEGARMRENVRMSLVHYHYFVATQPP